MRGDCFRSLARIGAQVKCNDMDRRAKNLSPTFNSSASRALNLGLSSFGWPD